MEICECGNEYSDSRKDNKFLKNASLNAVDLLIGIKIPLAISRHENHLLQNGFLHGINVDLEDEGDILLRNIPRRTPVRDMHVAFQIPYVYDYINKSCRQQAEVILNHENENVRYIG
jgi:hypothetical protein